jgi:hypothetical protein
MLFEIVNANAASPNQKLLSARVMNEQVTMTASGCVTASRSLASEVRAARLLVCQFSIWNTRKP